MIAFLALFIAAYGQGIFKNCGLSFGISFQNQDRRLYDFPMQDEIIEQEESSKDHSVEIIFNKKYLDGNKIKISFGVGYLLNISKFSRPFDHNYFDNLSTFDLRYIETYKIHNLRISNDIKYILFGDSINNLSIHVPFGVNFAFNKFIKGKYREWQADKWIFSVNNIDLYGGLEYKINEFEIAFDYRIFNIQKIDEVIFNYILTLDNDANFYNNEYENYNITNFKLSIGYNF